MAGLGQASVLLDVSFCCFWSDAAVSPHGRDLFILTSGVTSYKSFPLWSQFLHLNLGTLGCAALYGICHLRQETLALT